MSKIKLIIRIEHNANNPLESKIVFYYQGTLNDANPDQNADEKLTEKSLVSKLSVSLEIFIICLEGKEFYIRSNSSNNGLIFKSDTLWTSITNINDFIDRLASIPDDIEVVLEGYHNTLDFITKIRNSPYNVGLNVLCQLLVREAKVIAAVFESSLLCRLPNNGDEKVEIAERYQIKTSTDRYPGFFEMTAPSCAIIGKLQVIENAIAKLNPAFIFPWEIYLKYDHHFRAYIYDTETALSTALINSLVPCFTMGTLCISSKKPHCNTVFELISKMRSVTHLILMGVVIDDALAKAIFDAVRNNLNIIEIEFINVAIDNAWLQRITAVAKLRKANDWNEVGSEVAFQLYSEISPLANPEYGEAQYLMAQLICHHSSFTPQDGNFKQETPANQRERILAMMPHLDNAAAQGHSPATWDQAKYLKILYPDVPNKDEQLVLWRMEHEKQPKRMVKTEKIKSVFMAFLNKLVHEFARTGQNSLFPIGLTRKSRDLQAAIDHYRQQADYLGDMDAILDFHAQVEGRQQKSIRDVLANEKQDLAYVTSLVTSLRASWNLVSTGAASNNDEKQETSASQMVIDELDKLRLMDCLEYLVDEFAGIGKRVFVRGMTKKSNELREAIDRYKQQGNHILDLDAILDFSPPDHVSIRAVLAKDKRDLICVTSLIAGLKLHNQPERNESRVQLA